MTDNAEEGKYLLVNDQVLVITSNTSIKYVKESGKEKFSQGTKEQLQKTISIWMDDTMISAPTVNEQITNGEAVITMGGATAEEAEALVFPED